GEWRGELEVKGGVFSLGLWFLGGRGVFLFSPLRPPLPAKRTRVETLPPIGLGCLFFCRQYCPGLYGSERATVDCPFAALGLWISGFRWFSGNGEFSRQVEEVPRWTRDATARAGLGLRVSRSARRNRKRPQARRTKI